MKRVFVGMSGGVDSSVSAALLKQQGYDVTGVYMKNWAQDLPGFKCPWREDLADAKRVAVQLDIPLKIYDFQDEYRQKVVDYMIDEYKAGRTPNPDIMCNQEVKFKLFLESALADGADMIATGHYARIKKNPKDQLKKTPCMLYAAKDDNKDQTYFLYRISQAALEKTIFPLGDLTKPEVRRLAKKFNLVTAEKKDSVGICFVGEIGMHDFLEKFTKPKPGDIIDQASQKVVGRHEGAIFYTIGQRRGLGVGGGLPYYVVGKDMAKNEVYVSRDVSSQDLWRETLNLTDVHWMNQAPSPADKLFLRFRHRGNLNAVKKLSISQKTAKIKLADPIKAAATGQSAVLYGEDGRVYGGGIIA